MFSYGIKGINVLLAQNMTWNEKEKQNNNNKTLIAYFYATIGLFLLLFADHSPCVIFLIQPVLNAVLRQIVSDGISFKFILKITLSCVILPLTAGLML